MTGDNVGNKPWNWTSYFSKVDQNSSWRRHHSSLPLNGPISATNWRLHFYVCTCTICGKYPRSASDSNDSELPKPSSLLFEIYRFSEIMATFLSRKWQTTYPILGETLLSLVLPWASEGSGDLNIFRSSWAWGNYPSLKTSWPSDAMHIPSSW